MKTFIGIVLILHGLVHIGITLAPGAGEAAIRQTGITLMVLATAAFVLAGIIYLMTGRLGPIAIVAAVVSLIFLAASWHPWLVVGLALDLAVLPAVVLKWAPAVR